MFEEWDRKSQSVIIGLDGKWSRDGSQRFVTNTVRVVGSLVERIN